MLAPRAYHTASWGAPRRASIDALPEAARAFAGATTADEKIAGYADVSDAAAGIRRLIALLPKRHALMPPASIRGPTGYDFRAACFRIYRGHGRRYRSLTSSACAPPRSTGRWRAALRQGIAAMPCRASQDGGETRFSGAAILSRRVVFVARPRLLNDVTTIFYCLPLAMPRRGPMLRPRRFGAWMSLTGHRRCFGRCHFAVSMMPIAADDGRSGLFRLRGHRRVAALFSLKFTDCREADAQEERPSLRHTARRLSPV